MNTKRISLAVACAIGSIVTPAAHAISGCSNTTLNGNYAIQFSGTSAPSVATSLAGLALPASVSQAKDASTGSYSTVPAEGIVKLFLDGNGLLLGNAAVSANGTWLQGSVSGQYTVNAECSVSFTMSDASGATGNLSGVVVGQGDTVFVQQTDAGSGVTGILKKSRGFCQTADLVGSFGIQYSGTSIADGNVYHSVGILNLDGQGSVSGAESRFSKGTTSKVASTGTIAVNPDCSAVITVTSQDAAGQSFTFLGMVSIDNKQLLLIQSDAGMAGFGSIVAQ
jgi:hypothetical protein